MSTLRSKMALAGGAVVLYFLMIGAFQHWSGASVAAFGGYPDESSHYLSGLMIHDYCASGFSTFPFTFASNYYTHLPFIAIGYWPPFFYVMEALWMALFGFHRSAVAASSRASGSLSVRHNILAAQGSAGRSGGVSGRLSPSVYAGTVD